MGTHAPLAQHAKEASGGTKSIGGYGILLLLKPERAASGLFGRVWGDCQGGWGTKHLKKGLSKVAEKQSRQFSRVECTVWWRKVSGPSESLLKLIFWSTFRLGGGPARPGSRPEKGGVAQESFGGGKKEKISNRSFAERP